MSSFLLRRVVVGSALVGLMLQAAPLPGYATVEDEDCDLALDPEGDHYLVSSEDDLDILSDDTGCLDESIVQTATFSVETAPWVPIDDFIGTYDGGGYEISGIELATGGSDAGLFNTGDGAEIRDLTVVVEDMTNGDSASSIGAVVGYADGDLTMSGVSAEGEIYGDQRVGGLVGYATGRLEISESSFSGTVFATTGEVGGIVGVADAEIVFSGVDVDSDVASDGGDAGGLIGYSGADDFDSTTLEVYIGNSSFEFVTDGVSAEDANVGGLIGSIDGVISVINTTVEGDVSTATNDNNAGGFIGYSAADEIGVVEITIWDSSMTGDVSGGTNLGGLVGSADGEMDFQRTDVVGDVVANENNAGGLVGYSSLDDSATVEIAIAEVSMIGSVDGGLNLGGLIGSVDGNVDISDSSFEGDLTGTSEMGGLIGYSSADDNDGGSLEIVVENTTVTADVEFSGGDNLGGVIGSLDGEVRLEEVEVDAGIDGGQGVGGFIGYSSSNDNDSSTTEIDIVSSRFSSSAGISGGDNVGGAIGSADGVIALTDVDVESNISGDDGADRIGGLIGYSTETDIDSSTAEVTITDSSFTGDLVVPGLNFGMGGAIGTAEGTLLLSGVDVEGNLTGREAVGGFVGYSYASVEDPDHMDVYIESSTFTGNVEGVSGLGGAIGTLDGIVHLDGVHVDGQIGNVSDAEDYVGGLIGYAAATDADANTAEVRIEDSSYSAGLTMGVIGTQQMGGLVGETDGSMELIGVSVDGNVTGTGDYIGGLVGDVGEGDQTSPNLRVSDCYVHGNVSGGQLTGGIAGQVEGVAQIEGCHVEGTVLAYGDWVGGFIGLQTGFGDGDPVDVAIDTSVFQGSVRGESSVGGMVGEAEGTVVVAGSWVTGDVVSLDLVGGSYLGGLVGESSADDLDKETIEFSVVNTFVEISMGGLAFLGGVVGEVKGQVQLDHVQVVDASIEGAMGMVGGMIGSSTADLGDDEVPDISIQSSSFTASRLPGISVPTGDRVGGIIGDLSGFVVLDRVGVSAPIEGWSNVGGLIGYSGADRSGTPGEVIVTNSYFGPLREDSDEDGPDVASVSGDVSSSGVLMGSVLGDVAIRWSYVGLDDWGVLPMIGDLVGDLSAADSLCLSSVEACTLSNFEPVSEAQLRDADYLATWTWDMEDVWTIGGPKNNGFPILRTGDLFISGPFIEAGIRRNGSIGGSDQQPADWHGTGGAKNTGDEVEGPTSVGLVADVGLDGWGDLDTDIALPGDPAEGWAIQVGSSYVRRNHQFWTSIDTAEKLGLFGEINQDSGSSVTWHGYTPELDITQEFVADSGSATLTINVTIENISGSVTNMSYLRFIDPDNCHDKDSAVFSCGGTFDTENTIISQARDGDATSRVEAASSDGVKLILESDDPDSEVLVDCGVDGWHVPEIRDLLSVYELPLALDASSCGDYMNESGSSLTEDVPIMLLVNKTIGAGETVSFSLTYSAGVVTHESRRGPGARSKSAEFDPAGGRCVVGGVTHTDSWTTSFRRSLDLPTAANCTRPGYAFLGWRTGSGLPVSGRISEKAKLVASWGALPAAPQLIIPLANFFCGPCQAVLLVWSSTTDGSVTETQIQVDGRNASCGIRGAVYGLEFCLISGLTSGARHDFSVSYRNQNGYGPSAKASVTLI